MNAENFSALMTKFQSATWSLIYPTNDTKTFKTRINDQVVVLYNVRDPLYINGKKPDLSDEQTGEVMSFVTNTLLPSFESDISDAENSEQQELTAAILSIIE